MFWVPIKFLCLVIGPAVCVSGCGCCNNWRARWSGIRQLRIVVEFLTGIFFFLKEDWDVFSSMRGSSSKKSSLRTDLYYAGGQMWCSHSLFWPYKPCLAQWIFNVCVENFTREFQKGSGPIFKGMWPLSPSERFRDSREFYHSFINSHRNFTLRSEGAIGSASLTFFVTEPWHPTQLALYGTR